MVTRSDQVLCRAVDTKISIASDWKTEVHCFSLISVSVFLLLLDFFLLPSSVPLFISFFSTQGAPLAMAYPVDKTRRVGGDDEDGYTYYPIVVIGGGESGIAMGCQIKSQLRCDQFRIFERSSLVGGTWYSNTYPGVACDM